VGDKTFKIFLVNEARSDDGWSDKIRTSVADRIRELFDLCCNGHKTFGSSEANWSTGAPASGSVEDHELVLYFLANRNKSKVAKEGGESAHSAGATYAATKGMISEIYVDESWGDGRPGLLFGNLAFHELMHNKLDAHTTLRTVSDIHTQGGKGLAAPKIDAGTKHTEDNIKYMRAALDRKIKQYLGSGSISSFLCGHLSRRYHIRALRSETGQRYLPALIVSQPERARWTRECRSSRSSHRSRRCWTTPSFRR
jgi:hypothetical protein